MEEGLNLIHGISPNNKYINLYKSAASPHVGYLYNSRNNEYLCWLEEMM